MEKAFLHRHMSSIYAKSKKPGDSAYAVEIHSPAKQGRESLVGSPGSGVSALQASLFKSLNVLSFGMLPKLGVSCELRKVK